jgi:hypothetical protein
MSVDTDTGGNDSGVIFCGVVLCVCVFVSVCLCGFYIVWCVIWCVIFSLICDLCNG